jgi:hypothetical protein
MPNILCEAMERLAGIDAAKVIDRAAPAKLPVLRKSDLPTLHAACAAIRPRQIRGTRLKYRLDCRSRR